MFFSLTNACWHDCQRFSVKIQFNDTAARLTKPIAYLRQ